MMIQMSLPFALAVVLSASAVAQEINDPGKNSTYRGIPSPEITPRGKAGAQTDTKEPDYYEVTDESGEVFRMPTTEKVLKDKEAFEAQYDLTPFEQFATSRAFLFGRPFKEASQYRGQDYRRLLGFLRDSAWQESWSSIVITIGATCDDAAVDHLIAYYEEEMHTQTYREQFLLQQAKGNTLLSLGYCVATTKSQRALHFLQLSLKKGRLDVAKKSVATGEHIDDHQLNRAVLGLTVAGTQESVRTLEDYQRELTRRAKDAQKNDYVHEENEVVSSRLKSARRIQEIGIEAYYDE